MAVAIVMMIAGGVGTYWLGIGAIDKSARERDYDIGVRIVEIAATQKAVVARLDRIEAAALRCDARALDDLLNSLREIQKQMQLHDPRLPPLGRKSGAIEPWRPVDG